MDPALFSAQNPYPDPGVVKSTEITLKSTEITVKSTEITLKSTEITVKSTQITVKYVLTFTFRYLPEFSMIESGFRIL